MQAVSEPEFIPGLDLARLFYQQAVRPILDESFPGLAHSAGLLGPGSEILGFDDEMSADHHWGPRVLLFLSPADHARVAEDMRKALGQHLPFTFQGFPTHYEALPDEPSTLMPRLTAERPINHRVRIWVLRDFVRLHAGLELERPMPAVDWLAVPEQKLRTLVTGAVYHDGLMVLEPMRRQLATYPRDVWRYLLSAQWQRIGQEEPFVGRAGFVGDELGSAIIAARLVRDVMRLCFLMERCYAPYPKWFGAAFARLACAPRLNPILEGVLRARTWQKRQQQLVEATEFLVAMHNDLGITAPQPARASQFYDRPFLVIHAERVARAIWETIVDPEVKQLPFGVGKIDQWADSTDILSHVDRCRRLITVYREADPGSSL